MGVRTRFTIDFSISENSTGGKELGQTPPWSGVSDVNDDGGSFKRKLSAGASNILIDIAGLTGFSAVRLLAMKADQTITYKKNSSAGEAWTLRPIGVGALDGVVFMTTDGITSLYLSNPGAIDTEVTISFGGVF